MSNTRIKLGEAEKKIEDNTSPTMDLREKSKEFFAGLINQVSTSFYAIIYNINEELVECIKNHHDMRLEIEIANGSIIPGNSTLQWGSHESH
jgi:hypothetical protein